MMNGEILLSASALMISIVTIFEVKHLKPARPSPPGPAATFDRCSLPNVLGTQISPTQRESALEYVCAATVDLSLSNCIFFSCRVVVLHKLARVQHMLDYEAVASECTKALRALACLAYNDVNEVVLSSG